MKTWIQSLSIQNSQKCRLSIKKKPDGAYVTEGLLTRKFKQQQSEIKH